MSFVRSVRVSALFAATCTLSAPSIQAIAGTRPQVDLSVSVTTTPEPFVPGGIGTVTMTVRNEGPETAGGTLPNQNSINVREKPYDIVMRPPPFLFFEPAIGCSAYADISEYIPGVPGGGITLLYSYYFGAIAPGETRTCTYRIQFLSSTRADFPTYWRTTSPNDDDINPENNRFDYTFIAGPSPASVPVPALSAIGLLILVAGLLLAVVNARRRRLVCLCHSHDPFG
jgi:hypothetical protein